jgi:hypothetical protein
VEKCFHLLLAVQVRPFLLSVARKQVTVLRARPMLRVAFRASSE